MPGDVGEEGDEEDLGEAPKGFGVVGFRLDHVYYLLGEEMRDIILWIQQDCRPRFIQCPDALNLLFECFTLSTEYKST